MNRKEAIVVALGICLVFVTGVFADTTTTSRTSGGTIQTTSADIQVFNFNGATLILFDPNSNTAYATPSTGVTLGNETFTFSFAPNAVFQQVSSVKATIVYEAANVQTTGGHWCACGSQPGDRLLASMNGMFVSNTSISGGLPATTVLTLSNLNVGSNTLNLAIQGTGAYSIYQIRFTVQYTFLA